jgi:N-acetylmuramoyl-L-alanine amidase
MVSRPDTVQGTSKEEGKMQKTRQLVLAIGLGIAFVWTAAAFVPNAANAFSPQVIQKGATGDDVVELQARLQYIGYYRGKIDGVFGWQTYWALRNFQQRYGLKVDGLAGADTKKKLVSVTRYDKKFVMDNIRKGNRFTYYGGVPLQRQTTESYRGQPSKTGAPGGKGGQPAANTAKKANYNHLPAGFSQSDINLMANAVYGEARGEPYIGQVAVAAVILNRIQSPLFPDTVAGVIFQPGAFTAVQDGQIWLTPNQQAKQAVLDALNGWDPTNGALYYFNPDKATSAWIWSRPQIGKIGKHIFTK